MRPLVIYTLGERYEGHMDSDIDKCSQFLVIVQGFGVWVWGGLKKRNEGMGRV